MVLHAQPADSSAGQSTQQPSDAPAAQEFEAAPQPPLDARLDFSAPAPSASFASLRNPFPPIRNGIGHLGDGDSTFDDGMAYNPALTNDQSPLDQKMKLSKKSAKKLAEKKKKAARGKTR